MTTFTVLSTFHVTLQLKYGVLVIMVPCMMEMFSGVTITQLEMLFPSVKKTTRRLPCCYRHGSCFQMLFWNLIPEKHGNMSCFAIYMFPLSPLLVYWLHNWKTRQQDQWDSPGLWSSHQNCQRHWWLSHAPSHDHRLTSQHQRGPVPHKRQVRHYTGRPRPAGLHIAARW